MFHSERVRLLLGYADTRPSLSIWRGAVEQGSARLLTLCVWSLLSLPCSVSRFFLGVPVHPMSVLLQLAFGMALGFPCLVSCTGCLTALLAGPRPPMGQAATKMISELLRSFRFCNRRKSNIKTQRVALLASPKRIKWQFVVNPGPKQCPHSAHSVPTQCPHSAHTVPTGKTWDARIQEFNPI